MASPTILLSNGVKMPQVGLGTWQSKDNDVKIATKEAIKAGYRLIDTAEAYQNEHVIGEAIKECIEEGIIKREDLFITTKYMPAHENVLDDMESALRESIKKLGTDYVDLYLIHAPCALSPDWKTHQNVTVEQLWTSFEQLYNQKLTRSIGVSNFSVEQIERVMKIAKVPIHNQQVELSIYWPQHELHEVCKKYNISITSYGTLGSPGRRDFVLPDGTKPFSDSHPNQLEDKNVLSLAKKHNKTPAQILLRYVMDRGIAVIPKSVNAKRVKENFDDTTLPENGILASKNCSVTIGFQLFDFSLTKDEIALLESSGHRFGTFILEFWSNHPEDPYKNVRQ